MNLLSFPVLWHPPYHEPLARALAAHGISECRGGAVRTNTLRTRRGDMDGVHFHFVQWHWRMGGIRAIFKLMVLWRFCRTAKRFNLPIIWTVHDLHPFVERLSWIDRIGYGVVSRYADLITVHSRSTETRLRELTRPRCEIVVMPHGNFVGTHTPTLSRRETREAYGLAHDRPVVGMIGFIRPDRGIGLGLEAMEAFKDVQVLVAGSFPGTLTAGNGGRNYRARIRSQIANNPQARFCEGYMDDGEYANAVTACDVILLPYERITTSGALLAAWSLKRAVVTTDLPFFREMAPTDQAAGVVSRGRTPKALAAAVRQSLSYAPERRERAAESEAAKYAWDVMVLPFVEALNRNAAISSRAVPTIDTEID